MLLFSFLLPEIEPALLFGIPLRAARRFFGQPGLLALQLKGLPGACSDARAGGYPETFFSHSTAQLASTAAP